VVLPAYNAAGFIHKAIESALRQTLAPHEIIVVDDGSGDETASVAGRFPVRVIRKANGGPGSARNAGIAEARGDFIALLDHDDTWHLNKNEIQMKYFDTGIDAVFSMKAAPLADTTFEQMFWKNLGGNPSSSIIRRQALLDLGLFDDDPEMMGLDDYNFWLKFLWSGHKFRETPVLYDFTPVENHYGGNAAKMLAAELKNIGKVAEMARVSNDIVAKRKDRLRRDYLPQLIDQRDLALARKLIKELGTTDDYLRFGKAFLPAEILNLKRRIKSLVRP
jgi:glycosyltransferase involved in cell wall biosynthesis